MFASAEFVRVLFAHCLSRLTVCCETGELLFQPRSMHCLSQACRINIYIIKSWMSGMLLLVDEKVFVVFTVCVWTWAFSCEFWVWSSEKWYTVYMPADLKGRYHLTRVRENGLPVCDCYVPSLIYDAECFFAMLCECLRVKRTFLGTLRLVRGSENKLPGPWDKQLQEWLSDTWPRPDTFHFTLAHGGIKNASKDCLNINKFNIAHGPDKFGIEWQIMTQRALQGRFLSASRS